MFFTIYTILLMTGGVLLIVMGVAVPSQGALMRVLNIVVGALFFGYGFYLQFLFKSGTYNVYLYAFIGPVLLIYGTFRSRKANRAAVAVAVAQQARIDQEIAARQGGNGAPPQGQFGGETTQQG